MRHPNIKSLSARSFPAFLESLEARTLLATTPVNINLSQMFDSQVEGAIAINPGNPNHIVAASNMEFDAGLFTAVSTDGGFTWSRKVIADGSDDLYLACCDPTVAIDEFGNIFIGYMNINTNAAILVLSTDGGETFERLARWRGDVDQPTVVARGGAVWVNFADEDYVTAVGAPVTGLGQIGTFTPRVPLRGSFGGNFGDIAIGPDGQVVVAYQKPVGDSGPSNILINRDPDGLGPRGFSRKILVTSTRVGGFHTIPAQPTGEIDAEVDVEFDNSSGAQRGRLYMVYTGASKVKGDTNIALRFSDDTGSTWTAPRRLNTDNTRHSQFLPRLAVDDTSGRIAVVWHDARNDTGVIGQGSTDTRANNEAQFWGVIGTPNAKGVTFDPNFQISAGTSSAFRADNAIDYGDYTGLAFHSNRIRPIWADNSNSTSDNPARRPRTFDIYTAIIEI